MWYSCQKENDPAAEYEVSFNVLSKSSKLKSITGLKSTEVNYLSDAAKIIISIKQSDGSPSDYTQYEMNILSLGNKFITPKITLLEGNYMLTEFYVLNASDSVIFCYTNTVFVG